MICGEKTENPKIYWHWHKNAKSICLYEPSHILWIQKEVKIIGYQ